VTTTSVSSYSTLKRDVTLAGQMPLTYYVVLSVHCR